MAKTELYLATDIQVPDKTEVERGPDGKDREVMRLKTLPAGTLLSEHEGVELSDVDMRRMQASGALRAPTLQDTADAEARKKLAASTDAQADQSIERRALVAKHADARKQIEQDAEREKQEKLAALDEEQAKELEALAESEAEALNEAGEGEGEEKKAARKSRRNR